MGQEKIIISRSVEDFLKSLVLTLYHEEYFSFVESAEEYVNRIYDGIYTGLPQSTHHQTPPELTKYGNYYVKLKGSKRTMWYVFFDKSGNRYIIEFITNSHTPQSTFLNKL